MVIRRMEGLLKDYEKGRGCSRF
jgi:hypothetical protein